MYNTANTKRPLPPLHCSVERRGGAMTKGIKNTEAEIVTLDWGEFCRGLQKPALSPRKTSAKWITAALVEPQRKRECERGMGNVVILDIEQGKREDAPLPPDPRKLWDTFRTLFPRIACAYYTSYSHTAEQPRFRFIVLCSRDMSYEEWLAVSKAVGGELGAGDITDRCSYDHAKAMFLPCCKDEEAAKSYLYGYATADTVPLDVDAVLAGEALKLSAKSSINDEEDEDEEAAAEWLATLTPRTEFEDDWEDILDQCRHTSFGPLPYAEWVKLAISLHCIPLGREIFHAISANAGGFKDAQDVERKWKQTENATGGVTIATAVRYLHENGVHISKKCMDCELPALSSSSVASEEDDEDDEDEKRRKRLMRELLADIPQCPTLPVNALPKRLQGYVREAASVYCVPTDYIVAPLLTAAATLAGANATYTFGQYKRVPLNLAVLLVGTSGMGKSSPARKIFSPLFAIDRNMGMFYEAALAEAEEEAAGGKKAATKRIPEQAVILNDATPEKIWLTAKDTPKGFLLYCDEFASALTAVDRYSKGDSVSHFINLLNGDTVKVSRVGAPTLRIERPWCSTFGTIQPRRIGEMFGGKSVWANGGAQQRFCFIHPTSTPPLSRESIGREIPNEIQNVWEEFATTLYAFREKGCGLNMKLDDEAHELYLDFMEATDKRGRTCGEFERTVWAKLRITILKIAAILHLLNLCEAGTLLADTPPDKITAEEMEQAKKGVLAIFRGNMEALKLSGVSDNPLEHLANGEIMRAFLERFHPKASQRAFAKAIGMSESSLRFLMKEPPKR